MPLPFLSACQPVYLFLNRVPQRIPAVKCLLFLTVIGLGSPVQAQDFGQAILPILTKYCNDCHSTKRQKGDLDLERFASPDEIKKHPSVWLNVIEQLDHSEMPPKDEPPLPPASKKQLVDWIQTTLNELAISQAGDPGPVVLRRLSNVEYTHTIRDLTGVETLDPAREFPVDGAAGEGFTNAGAALVMSPSLVTKYLDAAKEVAAHAVLLPDGLRFSTATSPADQTGEILTGIREFYQGYTVPGGGSAVNLQGIKFNTSDGGVLPLQRYLSALLGSRDALSSGTATLPQVAQAHGLNSKYLGLLWTALEDTKTSLLMDDLRARWQTATPADAAALSGWIQNWQHTLWRFTQVGHIGKRDGPAAWQLAVDPIAVSSEIQFKLPPPGPDGRVTFHLLANAAGDGASGDAGLWENPRLTAPGRPDLPLREVAATVPDWTTPCPPPFEGLNLPVRAPSVITIRIPADLAEGCEFKSTARLQPETGDEGRVQMRCLAGVPQGMAGAEANKCLVPGTPVLVNPASPAGQRVLAAFADFRQLFPAALCYTKIVPVDEVVTLTLYHREDEHFRRLMLDEAGAAGLDRRWGELHYVSRNALKQVDVFDQLWQYATQDADPGAFEPMREPIRRRAAAFQQELINSRPAHLAAMAGFAEKAWRRPLSPARRENLLQLYQKLLADGLEHEPAVRLVLARILVAPAFLYRGEQAAPGLPVAAVNHWELATRLSYFLWSSTPDKELLDLAAAGRLTDPAVLAAQTRRLLRDHKVRRLAMEFGCQWLHIRDLDTLDEKSERHFPTFAALRADMLEEAVQFLTDIFQTDRPVLWLLEADHTFVSKALASHYGLDVPGEGWHRVDGLRDHGRGGILGFSSILAKQSGASRTSPILRGNWLSEVVLGEKLPRPPKGVPVLPDDAPMDLTERQLTERHSSDPNCASCHRRIDPFGFALEGFDAIGRARLTDAAGLKIDPRSILPDGYELNGLAGLREYLAGPRRQDFLRQFCRKLLGYALGRAVQLSDRPLLETMVTQLGSGDGRAGSLVELIVSSQQFQQKRGAAWPAE